MVDGVIRLQRWLSLHAQDISAAAVFVAAKVSFNPVSSRSVTNVFAFLLSSSSGLWFVNPHGPAVGKDPHQYFVSEGTYEKERNKLFEHESMILKTLGFDLHISLPHKLALTYLQALGTSSTGLSARVVEHLNAALLSPQFIYITHQPNALAVAAIYLAAKEVGVKLVDGNWWEVFDVDRENLGFLVVALGTLKSFALSEREKWKDKRVPIH